MTDAIKEYFNLSTYAVAGASRNKDKFGYKVMCDLLNRGKTVYPVNPGVDDIDGIKCYKTVLDTPEVDAVHIITPPAVTEKIADMCIEKGVKFVWMQPGAESTKAIEKLEEAGIEVIHNTCVLIQ